MRTSMKPVKLAIQAHILESVYDYEENQFATIKDAATHLNSEFIRVAGHEFNLKRYPNHVDRFVDYLQGAPFNFEFENYKLEEFLNGLGINPKNKVYSSSEMWNLYGLLIYREMIKFATNE